MASFMYPHVQPAIFAAWGILAIAVEAARAAYAARVTHSDDRANPRRIHAILVLQAGGAGATIALGAILFMPRLPLAGQALYGGILFAIPAAGAVVSQSSRYMVAAYSTTILVPASITWMALHPSQSLSVACLTALYLVVIVLASADGHALLVRSVEIRHQRDRLIRDLEARNAEVRAAVAQAEDAAQARARVLAAASHDLRQPLHALSVYSAVLATNPPPESMHELASNIDQIVRSLGNLLHGLLDLSRLSSDHFVLDRQPVALDAVVASVCAEFERDAAAHAIVLHRELQPASVSGDALAIARITRNLLDNAIKYTQQGCVTVTTGLDATAAAPMAVLSVADTGRGIPAAEQTRIFEEFYQVDNPGRDRNKGVGLGLAIVSRLCELSGGRVTVESEVGRGTLFRVRLPALPGESAKAESRTAAEDISFAGIRIHAVDDEPDINRSMHQLLGAWGAQPRTADSVAAAERLFREHGRPDLLITDLRLGKGESGAEFATRMQCEYGAFPVLVTTGDTSGEALPEARLHGFTLLHKPVAAEVLRQALATALGMRTPADRSGAAS